MSTVHLDDGLHECCRIPAHPHEPTCFTEPLERDVAWQQVEDWLPAPRAWIPQPTVASASASVFGRLVRSHQVRGPLMTDAALAALAIDHGVAVVSADTDFARFSDDR